MLVQVQVLSPALYCVRGCVDRLNPLFFGVWGTWQQFGNILAVALESSNGQPSTADRHLSGDLPVPR
jgi:hypothetical protein